MLKEGPSFIVVWNVNFLAPMETSIGQKSKTKNKSCIWHSYHSLSYAQRVYYPNPQVISL